MPLSFVFWLLLFFWLCSGFWWGWSTPAPGRYPLYGFSFFLFCLFVIVGLKLFGQPIQ